MLMMDWERFKEVLASEIRPQPNIRCSFSSFQASPSLQEGDSRVMDSGRRISSIVYEDSIAEG